MRASRPVARPHPEQVPLCAGAVENPGPGVIPRDGSYFGRAREVGQSAVTQPVLVICVYSWVESFLVYGVQVLGGTLPTASGEFCLHKDGVKLEPSL